MERKDRADSICIVDRKQSLCTKGQFFEIFVIDLLLAKQAKFCKVASHQKLQRRATIDHRDDKLKYICDYIVDNSYLFCLVLDFRIVDAQEKSNQFEYNVIQQAGS